MIMIAGDSFGKGQKGWLMSREKRVKVHSFSGATTEEMKYVRKPLLERKAPHVILHCGTYDLAQESSCKEVAQKITSLGKDIVKKDVTCSFSMLTTRADGFNPLVSQEVKFEPNIDIINK